MGFLILFPYFISSTNRKNPYCASTVLICSYIRELGGILILTGFCRFKKIYIYIFKQKLLLLRRRNKS